MIHELQNNDVDYTYSLYRISSTCCATIEIKTIQRQTNFFSFLLLLLLLISKYLIRTGNEAHQVARTILNSFTYIQSIIFIELKNRVIVTMCLLERQRTSEVVYHETRH